MSFFGRTPNLYCRPPGRPAPTIAALDTAIIGAGPYGLSLAAHLRKSARSLRVFGSPMRFWSHHMPRGMRLKSEGFASNLDGPDGGYTLGAYCAEQHLPYADVGMPVPIETFIAYAHEFRRRFVAEVDEVDVTSLARDARSFRLTTAAGETVFARRVVVATGIASFARVPQEVAGLPAERLSHTSQHADLSPFAGKRVAVLGAGASAVDVAALLHAQGAEVELVARRAAIAFHDPPVEPRPMLERMKAPRSGLGIGWRSRLCTDAPLVFHAMPQSLRLRIVDRHLGPAPGWFVRQQVEGLVRMHLGTRLLSARVHGAGVRLICAGADTRPKEIDVDHVMAGTGYQVALSRLLFLDEPLRRAIESVADSPILSRHFESSIPGLFFVGTAAANSFGPMLRFAYGAGFAARRVVRRLSTA